MPLFQRHMLTSGFGLFFNAVFNAAHVELFYIDHRQILESSFYQTEAMFLKTALFVWRFFRENASEKRVCNHPFEPFAAHVELFYNEHHLILVPNFYQVEKCHLLFSTHVLLSPSKTLPSWWNFLWKGNVFFFAGFAWTMTKSTLWRGGVLRHLTKLNYLRWKFFHKRFFLCQMSFLFLKTRNRCMFWEWVVLWNTFRSGKVIWKKCQNFINFRPIFLEA